MEYKYLNFEGIPVLVFSVYDCIKKEAAKELNHVEHKCGSALDVNSPVELTEPLLILWLFQPVSFSPEDDPHEYRE